MMTSTTVSIMLLGLVIYALVVGGALFYYANKGTKDWYKGIDPNEEKMRKEKMRVADRMREGRY